MPNTTYYYRLLASNQAADSTGSERSFTTVAAAPDARTSAASDITASAATLNGSVNAQNSATTIHFEYTRIAGDYRSATAISATPDTLLDPDDTAVSVRASNLLPNTMYYYRVVATSDAGANAGTERRFTTSALVPIVSTLVASGVTSTTVSLNGTVNAQNSISTAYFQYTTVAGDYTGAIDITTTPAVASGRLATNVGVTLNNLDPNKTYYYRLVAQNAAGRVSGIERSFTTTAMPPVVASWSTIVRIAAKASTTLQVAAGGSGPMNYQWYKGQSGDTSTAIPGATGSSYTTPALVQATSYWVRVSNAGGSSDSPTVVVSVTYTTFLPLATQAASRAGAPGQPAESPRRQG